MSAADTYASYVSRYTFPVGRYYSITVTRSGEPGKDAWAIRDHASFRMNRKGVFDYEPSNSSKTDAYIREHTFTLEEALPLAAGIATERAREMSQR